jgi:hypothetical protein
LATAKDGDLVAAVRLPGRGRGRSPNGKVEEIFGQLGTERAISQIAVLRQGLPDVFRPTFSPTPNPWHRPKKVRARIGAICL